MNGSEYETADGGGACPEGAGVVRKPADVIPLEEEDEAVLSSS